jgi:hypothetical protein
MADALAEVGSWKSKKYFGRTGVDKPRAELEQQGLGCGAFSRNWDYQLSAWQDP